MFEIIRNTLHGYTWRDLFHPTRKYNEWRDAFQTMTDERENKIDAVLDEIAAEPIDTPERAAKADKALSEYFASGDLYLKELQRHMSASFGLIAIGSGLIVLGVVSLLFVMRMF